MSWVPAAGCHGEGAHHCVIQNSWFLGVLPVFPRSFETSKIIHSPSHTSWLIGFNIMAHYNPPITQVHLKELVQAIPHGISIPGYTSHLIITIIPNFFNRTQVYLVVPPTACGTEGDGCKQKISRRRRLIFSRGKTYWKMVNYDQWPFQDPKLEVPTIYKAYVREYPHKIWPYMV